ncbi:MAG: zinc ABC transporter substrate-binding protein [Magnetococcales bacterium]|nr:zinc ABC transporter substrate-binding protein [Magnetococcales bacterium]
MWAVTGVNQVMAEPVAVVASFTILADMVRVIGEDRVQVTTLVGPDGDAHAYQPTPVDARAVSQAQVLVINGLGFEGWMERLAQASGFKGRMVKASTGVKQLGQDPHAWQDLNNAKFYIDNITRVLTEVDPERAPAYRQASEHYRADLQALDTEIRHQLAELPPQRRKVITSHDAFGYFSAAYGITFLSPVGVNSEAEISAADMARIIRQIRSEGVKALFIENISNPKVAQRLAQETGAKMGGRLYSDALSGADGPAASYLDMFRHNVATLLRIM